MLDLDCLMPLKTPWLDWMIFISARLNSISILILFHVKNNWLISLLFLYTFIHFLRLFNSSYLKIWYILNLPFNLSLLIEMPSLNRNEGVACFECAREYTHKDASSHRRTCGVLNCSNCNFYTYSSEELTYHFKKKHYQHNVKLCAQHFPKTLQENVKLIIFVQNIEITMNFSFYCI